MSMPDFTIRRLPPHKEMMRCWKMSGGRVDSYGAGCENLLGGFVLMNDQEINRAVQYVTASTSYGRDTVATILKTGLGELTELAVQSTRQFERDDLLEYVSQWTIKRTGQPEPLVREVLGCAGRWLDEVYEEVSKQQAESPGVPPHDDDEGAEPV
jgi:hypothetical protein